MKILFSNLCGNYEALEAFSSAIKNLSESTLYCLGDVVIYGKDPFECFQYVNSEATIVLVAEDQYIFYESRNYEPAKDFHLSWTKNELFPNLLDNDWERFGNKWFFSNYKLAEKEVSYVCNLSKKLYLTSFLSRQFTSKELSSIFADIKTCFLGGIDLPGVFTQSGMFYSAKSLNYKLNLNDIGENKIIFPGSLGFPIGNSKISYIIYDHPYVEWVNKKYDSKNTLEKIENSLYSYPSVENYLWGMEGEEVFRNKQLVLSYTKPIKLTKS